MNVYQLQRWIEGEWKAFLMMSTRATSRREAMRWFRDNMELTPREWSTSRVVMRVDRR